MTPRWLPVALACLAGAATLRAQSYSQLSGLILDPSESAIPGALVVVSNQDTGFRREARSRLDGGYVIASLEAGVYKVTVRKEGFRTVIRFGVRLDAAQPARVDFVLPIGSVQEAITVEGTAPLLNRADGSLGTVVGRDRLDRLPLNGRSLLSLFELAPGTIVTPATRGEAGQFTSNGQRPNTHYFTIDGVSANTGVSGGGLPAQPTGGSLPGMTALGSLHGLTSLDALDEFRIETAGAAPEFGRLPGAQVTLVTRSGTNEFHGTLLYAFRHEDLAANDWFANRHGDGRAPLRLHDFGAALGGPIRRDRTFFFLSYEGMRLRQPYAWYVPVPSLAARGAAPAWLQPALNAFPLPNGPALGPGVAGWTGRNNRPSGLDVASLRLDHAVGSRITLFARYNQAPSNNQFGSTQISRLDLRSRSLTAGLNLRITPELVLDLRANTASAASWSSWMPTDPRTPPCYLEPVTAYFFRRPGLCGDLLRFSINGVGQIISGPEGRRGQTQYDLSSSVTLNTAAHAIRLGVDYVRLSPTRADATPTLGIIADTLDDFVNDRNVWTASAGAQSGSAVLKDLSVYAQDTWRITPALSATYGLRWELSPAPDSRLPAYYLDPVQGTVFADQRPLWPTGYTNFAPRLGLAWRPLAHSGTVIRAGAGLYYDSSLSIGTDVLNGGPLSVSQYGGKYPLFSSLLSFGFLPDLKLPWVLEHSLAVEHAFGGSQVVSLSYVGSAGRRLMRREMGGAGNSQTAWVALATNNGRSRYDGLQFQYRRNLARGLQSLVSYTWSHSLDNSSTDAGIYWAGGNLPRSREWASSDFDVRHALTAAVSYEPSRWRGWALDGILRARSGFPIDVLSDEQTMGVDFANAFRPDVVPGQPVWIADSAAPGGRRLNPAAFQAAPFLVQGTLGRNALTGFGMCQLDLALRREFRFEGRRALEIRLEAFNALNQANFADPARFLALPLFGQPASMLNLMLGTGSPGSGLAPLFQTGGSRSLQIALRLRL